jgi:hypothetical protein
LSPLLDYFNSYALAHAHARGCGLQNGHGLFYVYDGTSQDGELDEHRGVSVSYFQILDGSSWKFQALILFVFKSLSANWMFNLRKCLQRCHFHLDDDGFHAQASHQQLQIL